MEIIVIIVSKSCLPLNCRLLVRCHIFISCILKFYFPAYFTGNGKTKFNMAFGLKSGNLLMVTRLFMKVTFKIHLSRSNIIIVVKSYRIRIFKFESTKKHKSIKETSIIEWKLNIIEKFHFIQNLRN